MTVTGADPDQLRTTASQFVQAADRLQSSMKWLNGFVSNAAIWRGPDSERFRSEWNGQSVFALNAAINALRSGADVLRRNADEQEDASRADGGGGGAGGSGSTHSKQSANGLHDMWNEIHKIPKDSSGYRVQKVMVGDQEKYIVYIVGTDGSQTQTWGSNVNAMIGQVDEKQLAAIEKLVKGHEVMLVGYSQGGMDAQNIAQSGRLNVQQIVTFGSPVRSDLDVPALHLQATGDGVPGAAAGLPGPYFDSAIAASHNPSVFVGESDIRPNGHNGLTIHGGGYDDLSKTFDHEASNGDARAAESAAGLKSFQGDVVGQVDIDDKGSGSW